MEWLTQNWIWVLFGVGMIAMHMFGHGGHGGHGGHAGGGRDAERLPIKDGEQHASDQGPRHRH